MASILKKFNSIGGFSVGDETPIDVIDANANVSANNLSVSGDASITGNLSVLGTVSYIETSTTYITDPITETGGGPNGNALTSDDNMDRGSLLHYYDGKAIDAFIGWDNSNLEFTLASNVSVNNNVVTVNELGNIRLGNIIASNVDVTGYVNSNLIPGIPGDGLTQVGYDLGSETNPWKDLWLSGYSIKLGNTTITSGAANTLNTANANIFNTLLVGNINATGFANIEGDITSANANLGNLATANFVSVTANLTSGNADLGNLATANYFNITANLTSGNADLGNLATANYITVSNNLTVSGDASIAGNLSVMGTVSYIETTTTYVTDPLFELGGGANGNVLTSNDNMDRGTVLHYYTTKPIDAFIGWDSSNAEFALASNVTVDYANNIVAYNNYGNVRMGNVVLAGDITITGSVTAGSVSGSVGNAIPLGLPTVAVDPEGGNLVSPGTVTNWTSDTKVTDAIDDLNEVMENVRNNTYVKAPAFTANVTAAGQGTYVGLTISNTPTTTYGNPNRWDITWGDGTYSNGVSSLSPIPYHQYNTNVGSPYNVTVLAYNTGGLGTGNSASTTRSSYVTIYTADPIMGFSLYRASTGGTALTGSNLYASEGETFYLENTTTNTSMGSVTYTINWGDGNTDTISSDSAAGGVGGGRKSHVYATGQNSGTSTKTITLTLTSHTTANPASIPRNTTSSIKIYNPSIAAPNGLSTKTITFQTSVGTSPYLVANFANNTGGSTTYVAGVSVNRVTSATPVETVVMTTFAYNADDGYLRSFVNGSENGNIALTSSNDSGANLSLTLSSESDYNLLDATGTTVAFASSIYSPTLYKGFKAKVSKTNSELSVGVNNFKLSHSATGNTNIVEFVKDDVTSVPTVDLTNATLSNATNGTYRYISGIPYYNTGSPTITLASANIYNWIGQTYQNTTTPFQIEPGTNDESTSGGVVASQTKTYSQLDGATSFLTLGIPKANTGNTSSYAYTIGSQTINVAPASVAAVQTIKFLATNVNGSGAYATHSKKIQVFTATPSGFQEDSIACAVGGTNAVAKRIVISGTGATRAYNSATNYYTSGLWSGAQTIAGTDSAVVRWNALKHFATDLSSGYLPAGPDLATGRSGTQYFFGAFSRTARSSFTVTITGTIRGLYFAVPGTTIDTASTLNGWIDASIAYNGAGVPGANVAGGGNGSNGCAVGTLVPKGSAISAQTYTISLGTVSTTNSTGNQVLFSIALNAGDTVTSWSFA